VKTIVDLVALQAVGSTFWVRPPDLDLSSEEFHAAVQVWLFDGGDGFEIRRTHRLEGGSRQYDMVQVKRTH